MALGFSASPYACVSFLLPFPAGPQLAPQLGWGWGWGRRRIDPLAGPQTPLPCGSSQPVRALSRGSFQSHSSPATPRSSHAELGLLKMRAGSPSSRGSRCGFSDNSFNPSGASGTRPAPSPPLCESGVAWERMSSTGSFASRAHLWGRWLLKHLTNGETDERATPASLLGKGTERPGSPSSCLPFPLHQRFSHRRSCGPGLVKNPLFTTSDS